MKHRVRNLIFWSVLLIVTSVLLVLTGLSVIDLSLFGISAWAFILSVVCIIAMIWEFADGRATHIILFLAAIFMLCEPGIARLCGMPGDDLINNWILALAAVLFTIGGNTLFSAFKKKPVKVEFEDHRFNGTNSSRRINISDLYFDAASLVNGEITETIGNVNVYISNKSAYQGGGMITIHENVGRITLHIPSEWQVFTDVRNNVGKVYVPDQNSESYTSSITLKVTENVGTTEVVFD